MIYILGHLKKMAAMFIYGKTIIIRLSWPKPILTLLRRSGERFMTFRSSSFKHVPIVFLYILFTGDFIHTIYRGRPVFHWGDIKTLRILS